jgi:RNA polymerase sigma-70 factor (ECF subfamily)
MADMHALAACAEEALVKRARRGDRAAFGALVERYQRPLGSYLAHLTGDREAALDLTQETFVRAFGAIARTRPDLLVRPWLFRIATNLARDHNRRRRLLEWLPLRVVDQTMSLADDETTEERDVVRRALGRLRPDERSVLLLCGLEGLPYQQAAGVLGGSAEAVRKRFARAKEHFRAAYAALGGPSGGDPTAAAGWS